jgi:hypothetical protein
VRKKGCYFAAQYRHLVPRRGDRRANVAVAHSILIAAYHVLRGGGEYRELGPAHFDTMHHERLRRYHARRLAELGFEVELRPKEAAA